MQPSDSLIDFPALGGAVLSQIFLEHFQDLCPAHRAALDQAHHPLHIVEHQRIPRPGTALGNRDADRGHRRVLALRFGPAALLVQVALLPLALRSAVISDTPEGRLPLAVSFLAAKRTSQVFPAAITRISEEKDPAMPAPDQASPQVGLDSQNRSQDHVILQNQSGDWIPAIPLWTEPEMLRDRDCKKPRLALWMLMYSKTPSSYLTDSLLSRMEDEGSSGRQTTLPNSLR